MKQAIKITVIAIAAAIQLFVAGYGLYIAFFTSLSN